MPVARKIAAGTPMVYRFGDFTLDVGARQILFRRDEIHITPKAFELLQVLLENRDRAMSKADLQQRIWPDTFVEETNLATLIAEIRRALGDTASRPKFIRTVYGFGYRFIGVTGDSPGASKFWLTLERRHIPLMEGTNVIGRAPDAAIQIDAPSISRYHARIVIGEGEATLEDNASKNGTTLNGAPVTAPARLSDGDRFCLGAVALTFRTTSNAAQTETMPR